MATEVIDASENSTSLYSFSTLGTNEEYYHEAATEFDTSSEDLEDREENAHWELEEGCDLQLLHMLPIEILNKVLSHCSPATLCHLGRCSTATLGLTSQSWIWRDLMLRQWGPDLVMGVSNKKKAEYEVINGKIEATTTRMRSNTSLSDLSVISADLCSSGGGLSLSSAAASSSLQGSTRLTGLQALLEESEEAHGTASWEEWKLWYREIHRAARCTKFDIRHGVRDLIEKHGLPNTTGSIARFIKYSMPRLASFALRDFLHQQTNINVTSYFLRLWNFKGLSVLQMMRLVLGFIRLPRSDSSISRILEILALAWWEQNEEDEDSPRFSRLEDSSSFPSLASSGSSSPPSSPQTSTLLIQRIQQHAVAAEAAALARAAALAEAGGEEEAASSAPLSNPRRQNTARVMQHLHLAPLDVLDATNPWEQYKIPVHFTADRLRPRGGFHSPDAISTLCFAILMLETDQRTSAVKMKMTESAFISQSRGLNAGHNYPREMLRETYNSIKFHPLVLFSDRVASGRIQVHTTVSRFLWLSSNRTSDLRAEVNHGMLRVWELGARDENPIHSIPLNPSSTIVRCDFIGSPILSIGQSLDERTWNTVEVESLSVLGSTYFKFMVPSEQTQKWFSALHWNIHSATLDSRSP
jgi:hypothetical protein